MLEGNVTTAADGSVSVATEDGVARLAAGQVARIEAGEGPRARARRALAALPAGDVDAAYRLALATEAAGLPDLAAQAYEAVLAVERDHPAARRALGYEKVDGVWLKVPEARRRRGLVLYEGAWRLPLEAEAAARAVGTRAPSTAPAVDAELRTPDAHGRDRPRRRSRAPRPSRWRRRPRRRAGRPPRSSCSTRRRRSAPTRAGSSRRSATRRRSGPSSSPASATATPRSATRRSWPPRRSATTTSRSRSLKALGSDHPGLVANAARALATLGDPRAIGVLVERITGHGGSPRVVLEVVNRVSYIRDYDVEIAQAANIANPVVGVVTDGMVLDLHVLDASIERTVVETVLLDAFNTLSGAHATDAKGVLDWARAHPPVVTAPR